jgi:general L-amino acid transport system permease protein
VAVAYEELVNMWAGIALNQTGQALVIIAMTIVVYESLSLITSAFLNWYNRRIQLVER